MLGGPDATVAEVVVSVTVIVAVSVNGSEGVAVVVGPVVDAGLEVVVGWVADAVVVGMTVGVGVPLPVTNFASASWHLPQSNEI